MTYYSNVLPVGTILRSNTRSYTIAEVLGQGGFGITYRATAVLTVGNIKVDAQFAIKEHFVNEYCERDQETFAVVYSRPVANKVEDSRKDFLSEARRLRNLSNGENAHPGILCVNETFEANNTAYFVMEYLKGESLASCVNRRGPLSDIEMRRIMIPIIDAVAFLHREYITHLDIKPANIMLTEDKDGFLRPVLIDFGLSRHFDPVTGEPSSTIKQAGYSEGYAPIEQSEAFSHFHPGTDVYSLGATMLFTLTGHTPPSASTIDADTVRHALPAGLPASTVAAITESMRYVRKERPENATALLAVLTNGGDTRRYDNSPIVPEIYAPTKKTTPTVKSKPTPTPRREPAPTPKRGSDPAPKPKSKKGLYIVIAALLAILCIALLTRGFGMFDTPTGSQPGIVTVPTDTSDVKIPTDEPTDEQKPANDGEHQTKPTPEPAPEPTPKPKDEPDQKPKVEDPQPKPTTKPDDKNDNNTNPQTEEPKRQAKQDKVKFHTTPRHLDLAVRYNGKRGYFSSGEWSKLSSDEKLKYSKIGMVVSAKGQRFIVELRDRGTKTWDEAVKRYGKSMPTKAQGEALASIGWETWKSKMKAYGGDGTSGFWTKEAYDSSSAWVSYVSTGVVFHSYKTKLYRIRTITNL